MKKRKFLNRMIIICCAFFISFTSITTCYAATPNINSKFKTLTLGSNQLKKANYDYYTDVLAGCFKAPEAGKYKISITNNGSMNLGAYLLDKNLTEIQSCDVLTTDKETFSTISLKKNQKVYLYLDGLASRLLAAKVTITKVSTTPTLNKSTVSLKIGKTTSLKLKNNTKKIIWVSSNTKVATVTSKGVVKAKKKGSAYIYAIANFKLYKCKVTTY